MKTHMDLTDEEIIFIMKKLFQTEFAEDVLKINRVDNMIEVEMEAKIEEDGDIVTLGDNDCFELYQDGIKIYGFYDQEFFAKQKLYQQYLYAKGCHWINQDNEFLNMEERI